VAKAPELTLAEAALHRRLRPVAHFKPDEMQCMVFAIARWRLYSP